MAFLDEYDFESEYGTGERESSPGNNDMTGYDDTSYGYTRTDDSGGGGGGYVGSNLNDQEMADWEKRMSLGSGSRFNLDDDVKPVAQQAANYGGGGGGGNSVSSGSSITYARPLKAMPTLGDYGAVPTYDEGKVRSLQQEKAATGISKLRGAVSEAITRSVSMDNPYLRKMLMKDTLSGFGEGMGSVMNTADTNARTAYDTEYKGKLTGYQNNINRVNTMFEAAMRDFMARPYDMTSPIGPGISDPMTGKKL
jgi:hypothetical protein